MYIVFLMVYSRTVNKQNHSEEYKEMKVEIRDTAIRNIANGLKTIERNMKYWKDLAEDAKRNDAPDFITRSFEQKAESCRQQQFTAQQLLCELGEEFKKAVEAKMEAN